LERDSFPVSCINVGIIDLAIYMYKERPLYLLKFVVKKMLPVDADEMNTEQV